jgi:4-hydroxy-3-polyprenylbenzoate decarboxylase
LAAEVPAALSELQGFGQAALCMPGVVAISTPAFTDYAEAHRQVDALNAQLQPLVALAGNALHSVAIIVLCDDAAFTAATLRNYLWVTYTRCNPSHDIYGIASFIENKHWGCRGSLVIDARKKPHHAPPVEKDPAIERRIDRLFAKNGSLAALKL